MKKLMIAAAIVCAAAMSQAATYNWMQTKGSVLDGSNKGASTPAYNGTAYLIDAGVTSQQALLTAFLADGFDIEDYAIVDTKTSNPVTGTVSGGKVAKTADFGYNVASSFQAYYAIVNGDKIFISNLQPSGWQESAAQTITFATNPMVNSSTTMPEGTKTFSTANTWYAAAAVPEPTSGLLLLLGVAGLALRRRRA